MSKVAFGGITFGPSEVSVTVPPPVEVSVAVVERFFQTICASWPNPSAFASTTSVRTPGPASVRAGTVPTFHVIEPGVSCAVPEPVTGVAAVKLIPSAAGIVTDAPARSLQP